MKANNGSGNNPERDEWETPKELFDKLNKQYHFELDCCANYKNTKTKYYCYDFLDNYVAKVEICWMNPPFSKSYLMFVKFFQVVRKGVAIYRCDNLETKIWQDIIFSNADWIFIPKGRVSYTPFDITIRGGMTRFPSALIGYNVEPPKYLENGVVLKVN